MENLYPYGDYQFYDAEMFGDGTNRFGWALEIMHAILHLLGYDNKTAEG